MIGERLKLLRGKRTQQEIADRLGVSRASYSHYENGHVQPDNDILIKMADIFKVTTDYLLGNNSAEKLVDYLEMELTNEEIKERMTFKVDDITLTSEEVDEFVDWVRGQRIIAHMKKQRTAALSEPE